MSYLLESEEQCLEEYEERVCALAKYLDEDPDDVEALHDGLYFVGNAEYYVLTDDEADSVAEERVRSYVDDCVLHEIPQAYRDFFDTESFIEYVLRCDGRGHVISSYDGNEDEVDFKDETYYIFRIN